MIELDLSKVAREIVTEIGEVDETKETLIITDAEQLPVAKVLATACRAEGASTILQIMPRLKAHSNEPPTIVAESMLASDIAFTVTTHSITHTDAMRDAREAGIHTVIMRGVTVDMMLEGGVNTDYQALHKVTKAIRDIIHDGNTVHVESENGTDVEFDITDRPAFTLSGYATETGLGGAGVPPGEAPTAPLEGTTNGTIVFDYSIDNIGKLDAPVTLTVRDGMVEAIEGGSDADQFRELLDNEDENAKNIAEFAIGTNPDSRLIGNLMEDKKKEGTVHFAVGDNMTLGGNTKSNLHLDGMVLAPTVVIDGRKIVEDGTLLKDEIFR